MAALACLLKPSQSTCEVQRFFKVSASIPYDNAQNESPQLS